MKAEDTRVRQSQLVSTFGVGAIFPSGDHSYLICGLDEWDERRCAPIEEPRLARSLRVHNFRAPATGSRRGDVPVVRFPEFQYCPGCRRLGRFWEFDAGKMQCSDCVRELTPSRFVACCPKGHLEDFPYFQWVHRRVDGQATWDESARHLMKLETKGVSSSLADIVVKCSCGVRPRDLEGAFGRSALAPVKSCGGSRPWLPGAESEDCKESLRALQRGSANVWFSAVRSSISIPPWSSPNARFVTKHWDAFELMTDEAIKDVVARRAERDRELDAEGVMAVVNQRRGVVAGEPPSETQLREEEYRALIDGNDRGSHDSFQCVPAEVHPSIDGLVAQVSKVTRLREVRALYGFSRVTPVAAPDSPTDTPRLSLQPRDWLPAVEVFGEGVFVRLHDEVITQWERTDSARQRQDLLQRSVEARSDGLSADVMEAPNSRFIAIHTLAHALLKELSLDAGYPIGSLRERVFAAPGQSGILVYTAASDAAGSLGGLAALAGEQRFSDVLKSAFGRAGWCSNDPVCSEAGPSGSDGLNLAACHACILLPETSCEHRNIFLDRVALLADDAGGQEGGLAETLGR